VSVPESPSVTKVAYVTTSELHSKIESAWNAFWCGGISNPLEVFVEIFHQIKQTPGPEEVE